MENDENDPEYSEVHLHVPFCEGMSYKETLDYLQNYQKMMDKKELKGKIDDL